MTFINDFRTEFRRKAELSGERVDVAVYMASEKNLYIEWLEEKITAYNSQNTKCNHPSSKLKEVVVCECGEVVG